MLSPQQRERLLVAIRDEADANPANRVSLGKVGEQLGFSTSDRMAAAHYLKQKGLVNFADSGQGPIGPVSITSAGIDHVGSQRPDEPPQDRDVSSGDFSSGPDGGTELAVVLQPTEQRDVEALIRNLRLAIETAEIELPQEERADFEAQLDTLNAQLRSPKPKRKIHWLDA